MRPTALVLASFDEQIHTHDVIRHSDLSRLESALLDLYAPGLETENYAERTFHFLGQLFESELLGLMIRDTSSATIDISLDRYLRELEQVGEAFGQLGPQYPWFRADPEIHEGRPHCRSDFCSDRQFRDLDIHSEVFRKLGHQHFMSMHVHTEGSRVVFLGFNRGKRDFTAREKKLVTLARPHLSTARHLALALQAGKARPMTPELLTRRGFTPRESEVLYWLTEGKSNAEIAVILRIELSTVKGHVTAIFNKIGAGNRHAAILHALEMGRKLDAESVLSARRGVAVRVPYALPLPK